MSIATVLGLFLIPVCYVFVQRLSERGGKKATAPAAAATAPGAAPAHPPALVAVPPTAIAGAH